MAATGADPAEVVEKVNAFADRIPDAQCTTLAYCVIEQPASAAPALHWHAAGHPPPIVTDEDETTVLWDGRGLPLGVADRTRAVGSTTLRAGSLVVLYTDGLVERRGVGLDERIEQLRLLVHRYRHLPLGACLDCVIAEMTERYQNTDDLAVIGVRLAGSTPRRFVDVFPSTLESLPASRSRVRAWLAQHAPSAEDHRDALLAIGEAVANAIEHGNRMDPARTVAVEVCLHRRAVAGGHHRHDPAPASDERADPSVMLRVAGQASGLNTAPLGGDGAQPPSCTTVRPMVSRRS